MDGPLTLFEKIWTKHRILENNRGEALLLVDRHFLTDAAFISFEILKQHGRRIRKPDQTILVTDHTAATRNRAADIIDPEHRTALDLLRAHVLENGITWIDLKDPRQGIIHVVAPELGMTLPGTIIACDDSHTTTHGAFGALAFGVGLSDCAHVLASQTLWQPRYKTMRITLSGSLSPGVSAKDLILEVINQIGAGGAVGHILEFAGPAIAALSMEERMTVCNMSVEGGARAGIVNPDETTFSYLESRPLAPKGNDWRQAMAYWLQLKSDPGAHFDREVEIDARTISPMVTWGTSPEEVVSVCGTVPDPRVDSDLGRRRRTEAALLYMGLVPGTRMTDITIDRVFIGSCTNGRIEDLRSAAAIARHGKAAIPTMVVPGSGTVKRQAEAEGIDLVFRAAGFEWLEPGCSMCCGMNGDVAKQGQRCASTTNRNFVGRQGPGVRTHLMSPAMAAAAALTGRIADVRRFKDNS